MTDSDRERDPADPESLEDEVERTRKLILERRNRFMAAALAGIGMASGQACSSSVCLSIHVPSGGAGGSAGTTPNEPCPGRPARQPPCVCLSISPVAGQAGPVGGTIAPPVGGMVAPPIAGTVATQIAGRPATGGTGGTGGTAGTRPGVCLSAPVDEDAGTDP